MKWTRILMCGKAKMAPDIYTGENQKSTGKVNNSLLYVKLGFSY